MGVEFRFRLADHETAFVEKQNQVNKHVCQLSMPEPSEEALLGPNKERTLGGSHYARLPPGMRMLSRLETGTCFVSDVERFLM